MIFYLTSIRNVAFRTLADSSSLNRLFRVPPEEIPVDLISCSLEIPHWYFEIILIINKQSSAFENNDRNNRSN